MGCGPNRPNPTNSQSLVVMAPCCDGSVTSPPHNACTRRHYSGACVPTRNVGWRFAPCFLARGNPTLDEAEPLFGKEPSSVTWCAMAVRRCSDNTKYHRECLHCFTRITESWQISYSLSFHAQLVKVDSLSGGEYGDHLGVIGSDPRLFLGQGLPDRNSGFLGASTSLQVLPGQ